MNNNSSGILRRRHEILRLVRSRPVRSQEELQSLLRRQGFAAAQPTLSRDVKELGLARTAAGYAPPLEAPPSVPDDRRAEALDRVLGHSALAVRAAGTLVVVTTPPAGAQPVARAIDEARLAEVVGTVAGDDTIFVATPDAAAARRLERRLDRRVVRPTRRA